MEYINIQSLKTQYGVLQIGVFENQICQLDWLFRKQRKALDSKLAAQLNSSFIDNRLPLHQQVEKELSAYFKQERKTLQLPILMVGSEFEKSVWQQLLQIPYGKCISYSQLAEAIGNPNARRAVAAANGANQLAIVVPCHRVIGSQGALTGYSGGIVTKQKLIALEKNSIQSSLF